MSHFPIRDRGGLQGRMVPRSLIDLGIQVLGSQRKFKDWLHEPVFGLEGQKPIDVINKQANGLERVRGILLGIRGGFGA